jgi:hypothetical protein
MADGVHGFRLQTRRGKEHESPCVSRLETYLDGYISVVVISPLIAMFRALVTVIVRRFPRS